MNNLFNVYSWKDCKEMVIEAYELNREFSHCYNNHILGFAKWLSDRKIPLTKKQYGYLVSILDELRSMHKELMSEIVSDGI